MFTNIYFNEIKCLKSNYKPTSNMSKQYNLLEYLSSALLDNYLCQVFAVHGLLRVYGGAREPPHPVHSTDKQN